MIDSPSGSIFMYCVLLLTLHTLLCGVKKYHLCAASSSGEVHNISYPFQWKGDPGECGHPKYELACENNHTVLYQYADRYYVKSIGYGSNPDEEILDNFITVVDNGLQKGNCSSLPCYSLARSNFSRFINPYYPVDRFSAATVAFMKCSRPVASATYANTKPCIEGAHSADTPTNISQMKVYSYALLGYDLGVSDMKDSCTITMVSFASDYIWRGEGDQYNGVSSPYNYKDLHNVMRRDSNSTTIGKSFGEIEDLDFAFLVTDTEGKGAVTMEMLNRIYVQNNVAKLDVVLRGTHSLIY